MMEGTISTWNPEQLYGFIQPADKSDQVYVHFNEIQSNVPVKEGSKVLFEVRSTDHGREARAVKLLNSESPARGERRLKGRVTGGNDQRGLWFISPYDKSPDVAVHHTQLPPETEGFLIAGDEVEFSVVDRNSKPAATKVVVTSFAPQTRDPLTGFADMGRGPWLEKLAEISEEEPWGYASTPSNDELPVLRSYLKFTFMRLREMDGGVQESKTGAWASFNTGLVTPDQNEIYALFSARKKPSRRQWRFQQFTTLEDRNFVDLFGGEPPPLAEYYSDPSVLFYDKKLPLHINATHMMENIERFPEELRNNHHLAKLALEAQQASIEKRVHRNYKTAIPQFFRDKGGVGEIQLLLPLCLVNQRRADLALVVEKTESGDAYRGSTVLTLDMAYNNARLLVRPDSQWLKP
jgi:cold shock CspA family protein